MAAEPEGVPACLCTERSRWGLYRFRIVDQNNTVNREILEIRQYSRKKKPNIKNEILKQDYDLMAMATTFMSSFPQGYFVLDVLTSTC